MTKKNIYGWNPDLPDHRDHVYGEVHHVEKAVPLPTSVDLTDKMPPVFDQGDLGSCTANALSAAFGFLHPGFIASRLEIYYNERVLEGDVRQDNGAELRDGIKTIHKNGVCPESEWPYDVTRFARKPSAKAIADAKRHKITQYSRLTTSNDFHSCLAANFPFVIGFTVYESFESDEVAKTGIVPMPAHSEQSLGGHAVCVIGYDEHAKTYLVRNSWGADWGLHGNFLIPQAYLENSNLADDAWTIRL